VSSAAAALHLPQDAATLLNRVEDQLTEITARRHRDARVSTLLVRARLRLRTGVDAAIVQAELVAGLRGLMEWPS
jgi:hypothetical protein